MSFTHHHTPEQDGSRGRAGGPGSVGHAHDSREALAWEDPREVGPVGIMPPGRVNESSARAREHYRRALPSNNLLELLYYFEVVL